MPIHKGLVIIPAYNESETIGEVISSLRAIPVNFDLDIVVIDDGSEDDTSSVARAAGAHTIRLVHNLGYGFALKTGYEFALASDYDVLVQMDGDGQHAPHSLPELLAPLADAECDLVIGSRALSDVKYDMPFARRLGQRTFRWLLYKMSGLSITDPTSGFQALNRKAFAMCVSEDFPGDYPDTNVLLYLSLRGIRINDVPAEFRQSPTGKSMHSGILNPIYYVYKMSLSMALIYYRHKRQIQKRGN